MRPQRWLGSDGGVRLQRTQGNRFVITESTWHYTLLDRETGQCYRDVSVERLMSLADSIVVGKPDLKLIRGGRSDDSSADVNVVR